MQKRKIIILLITILATSFLFTSILFADVSNNLVNIAILVGDEYRDNEEIKAASVVADIYKIADVKDGKYVSYVENGNTPYEEVFGEGIKESDIDTDKAIEISQKTAEIALGQEKNHPKQTAVLENVQLGEKINLTEYDTGMYLIIAKGQTVSGNEYVRIMEDGSISTIARSSKSEFLFKPQIIGLSQYDEKDKDVVLKTEQQNLLSVLEIEKAIDTYEEGNPTTFVFHVADTQTGGDIYDNYFSLVFDTPGIKRVSIDDIPAGIEVSVSEVYSGSDYKLSSDETVTTITKADVTTRVYFKNRYAPTNTESAMINNNFRNDASGSAWDWKGISDRGEVFTNPEE